MPLWAITGVSHFRDIRENGQKYFDIKGKTPASIVSRIDDWSFFMADCKEQAYSNDYYDFIIPYGELAYVPVSGACTQRIDEDYDVYYYPREGLPELGLVDYPYTTIPKCYGLLDQTALEASGIIRMQNQPALSLKGNGVMIGFIDTGIDYTNPIFRYSDGSTRINRIWDQTIQDGTPPAGILYGADYSAEDINRALQSENPYDIVPSRDENGHGTFLAGVACGSEDIANDFIGAAPMSSIAVVKLKPAKQHLREFFFIPDEVPAFQENDIMLAISYLNGLANFNNMPLVICLAVGNNMGSHGRGGVLSSYLNYICTRRKRVVVTATGNEANAKHHFQGQITGNMEFENVEINVEEDMEGFFLELWSDAPQLYAVSVVSPSGEVIPRIPSRLGASERFAFVFENTTVSIDYRIEAKETGSQLIYFRFQAPKRGIWVIRVYPQNVISGIFNMWLPMRQLTGGNVFFLRSNPDVTLTIPGTALQPITVGGYNAANGSLYLDSGRGFTITGDVKPDFTAPAVNIYGPGLRHNFVTSTGTSGAAAITAGACAQILQWGLVEQNSPSMSNAEVKNMLIRGAGRTSDRSYPNQEWGYGTLDVYQAFNNLRV